MKLSAAAAAAVSIFAAGAAAGGPLDEAFNLQVSSPKFTFPLFNAVNGWLVLNKPLQHECERDPLVWAEFVMRDTEVYLFAPRGQVQQVYIDANGRLGYTPPGTPPTAKQVSQGFTMDPKEGLFWLGRPLVACPNENDPTTRDVYTWTQGSQRPGCEKIVGQKQPSLAASIRCKY